MDEELKKFREFGDEVMMYGQDIIQALIILVAGLIAVRMLVKYLKRLLRRLNLSETVVSSIGSIIYVLLLVLVVSAAFYHTGMRGVVIFRILGAIAVAAVGVIVLFRPLVPTLPFKVGNTIQAGGLLGTVEATTILNTQLRTFDGKTVFIPNRMILNETVVNFHFTPTRQIRLVLGITYHSDLMKAKKILSEIIAEDPRVLDKPTARVFVLNLTENCVEIAVRPWVKNADYWRTRCDLLEKIKLRFDHEGITIAFPQRDVHLYQGPVGISSPA